MWLKNYCLDVFSQLVHWNASLFVGIVSGVLNIHYNRERKEIVSITQLKIRTFHITNLVNVLRKLVQHSNEKRLYVVMHKLKNKFTFSFPI